MRVFTSFLCNKTWAITIPGILLSVSELQLHIYEPSMFPY